MEDTTQQFNVPSYRHQRWHVLPWVDSICDGAFVLFLVILEVPRELHTHKNIRKLTKCSELSKISSIRVYLRLSYWFYLAFHIERKDHIRAK